MTLSGSRAMYDLALDVRKICVSAKETYGFTKYIILKFRQAPSLKVTEMAISFTFSSAMSLSVCHCFPHPWALVPPTATSGS